MRPQRTQIVRVALFFSLASLGLIASAGAQVPESKIEKAATAATYAGIAAATTPSPTSVVVSDRPEDEKVIRAVGEAFRHAYDAGNAAAVASLYADNAELIQEDGERIEGRKSIQDLYASLFQERKGYTIQIVMESLRFLGPSFAKEEGQTIVTPALTAEPPSRCRYTVLYVKQAGQWLYSSVREESVTRVAHSERLKELEWLVGDWVDESADAVVTAACRWSADKNFLLRDFTIHTEGKPVMTVNQRIGWDPLSRQIKSWVFDSEGGYGDGLWTRSGDQWMIKSTGVLPDGRIATATNILTRVGPNTARWASTERTVGGEHAPDQFENTIVRRMAPPQILSR
jgi:uncharacterized protein (TIGR02246 family)